MTWLLGLLVGCVAILLAIAAHDFLSGEKLLADLLLEQRLKKISLQAADAWWKANPHRSNLVVSLTSIPSRHEALLTTLKTLMLQDLAPREIVLNLPLHSEREAAPYVVPDELATLSAVRVVRCMDRGPATKWWSTLGDVPKEQRVVVVDDDHLYSPLLLQELEAAAERQPGAVVAVSGWLAPDDLCDRPTTLWSNLLMRAPAPVRGHRVSTPFRVDVVQGCKGYLVQPSFFDLGQLLEWGSAPIQAKSVDDVWISAHCLVGKFVVPVSRVSGLPVQHNRLLRRTSLGLSNRGNGLNEQRPNTLMLRYFRDRWLTVRVGNDSEQ